MSPDLVDIIHHALCTDGDKCKRFSKEDTKGNTHYTYYRKKAERIRGKMEPITISANIPRIVRIILDEVTG